MIPKHIKERIDNLALRIDEASDNGDTAALEILDIECSDLFGSGEPSDALLHYFRSNIQNGLQSALSPQDSAWCQPYRERQILHLREASKISSFNALSSSLRAQILTNLANQMSALGRPVEALRIYESVLKSNPRFAMALANRGLVRLNFSRMVHDAEHRAVLAAYACRDLERVIDPDLDFESAPTHFIALVKARASEIRAAFDVERILAGAETDARPLGEGHARDYRLRMLNQGLFLNPLIVLGPHSFAACDPLHLPSHTFLNGLVPPLLGRYNQMKQEFVSARLLYHQAAEADPFNDCIPHFADYGVRLYDTLDFSAFSIGVENMRLAFRTAYGLLDKIAGFVNSYFELGHDPNKVSLRRVWYTAPSKRQELHPKIADRQNLALRGLYWLSFDIVGDARGSSGGTNDSLEPEAPHLNSLRNALEHRCLVLTTESFGMRSDDGIDREEITTFRRYTERILELGHEALILLSLAMHEDELLRRQHRGDRSLVFVSTLPEYRRV